MNHNIFITAVKNDPDYVTKVSVISSRELEYIKPLIEALNNFQSYEGTGPFTHHHNFPEQGHSHIGFQQYPI